MNVEFSLSATRIDSIPTKPHNIVNGFGTSSSMLHGKISFIRYGCYCHLDRGYSARNSHDATREGLEVEGLNMVAVGEENTSSNVSSSAVKKSANPFVAEGGGIAKGEKKEIVPSTAGHKDFIFPSSMSIVFSAGSGGVRTKDNHHDPGISHVADKGQPVSATREVVVCVTKIPPMIIELNGAMAMQMDRGP
ncbi:hypothetical protein NC652_039272 [Populus alba x Populus x berolinensis]|nr:hypothetical protein NC652_039272 [Populus alba x Populus x berolinensis]